MLITLTVSYADVMVVVALKFFSVIGDDELLQRLSAIEPAFLTLYDASKAWLERDDH